jgi:hypothetical protein
VPARKTRAVVLMVRVDDETRRRLDALARATRRSRSELVKGGDTGLRAAGEPVGNVPDRFADRIGMASLGPDRARRGEEILREAFAQTQARLNRVLVDTDPLVAWPDRQDQESYRMRCRGHRAGAWVQNAFISAREAYSLRWRSRCPPAWPQSGERR